MLETNWPPLIGPSVIALLSDNPYRLNRDCRPLLLSMPHRTLTAPWPWCWTIHIVWCCVSAALDKTPHIGIMRQRLRKKKKSISIAVCFPLLFINPRMEQPGSVEPWQSLDMEEKPKERSRKGFTAGEILTFSQSSRGFADLTRNNFLKWTFSI